MDLLGTASFRIQQGGMLAGLAPGKIGLRRLINVMPPSSTLAMTAGDVCDS